MNNFASLTLGCGLAACFALACGPSMEADRVMTPEERLQEQERLAYEQEQESRKSGGSDNFQYEEEEEKPFDDRHAAMELRRATLNAITCPEVVPDKKNPKAEADINVTFVKDGSVSEVSVSPPYADSPLEECIINAYKGVKVPPFKDAEKSVPWKADLTGKKRDLMKTEEDSKVEDFFKPEEAKDADKDAKGKDGKAKKAADKKKK